MPSSPRRGPAQLFSRLSGRSGRPLSWQVAAGTLAVAAAASGVAVASQVDHGPGTQVASAVNATSAQALLAARSAAADGAARSAIRSQEILAAQAQARAQAVAAAKAAAEAKAKAEARAQAIASARWQRKVAARATARAEARAQAIASAIWQRKVAARAKARAEARAQAVASANWQRRVEARRLRVIAQRKARLAASRAAARRTTAPVVTSSGWVFPIHGAELSASFGQAGGRWSTGFHTGQDFADPIGTPIHAIAAGVVVSARSEGAYGNKIVIRHAGGTLSWYCHMSRFAVSPGMTVRAGQVIGAVGATGNVTGPHLHLEVHPGGGGAVDPLAWLRSHGAR